MSESFDIIREICKLVKKSPSRETYLKSVREATKNESKGIHAFYPTRWKVRGEACIAMINNHEELCRLWEWSLDNLTDTEMKARVIGAQSYMNKHEFVFGCMLSNRILQRTDNLSRVLQRSTITAAEGSALAEIVVNEVERQRWDEGFKTFWQTVI